MQPNEEPTRNELVKLRDHLTVKIDPEADLSPAVLNSRISLTLTAPNGTALEIPLDAITINRRTSALQHFRCANCSGRIPRTGDPLTDHHAAQRHHLEQCGRNEAAELQHAEWVAEFEPQRKEQQATLEAFSKGASRERKNWLAKLFG